MIDAQQRLAACAPAGAVEEAEHAQAAHAAAHRRSPARCPGGGLPRRAVAEVGDHGAPAAVAGHLREALLIPAVVVIGHPDVELAGAAADHLGIEAKLVEVEQVAVDLHERPARADGALVQRQRERDGQAGAAFGGRGGIAVGDGGEQRQRAFLPVLVRILEGEPAAAPAGAHDGVVVGVVDRLRMHDLQRSPVACRDQPGHAAQEAVQALLLLRSRGHRGHAQAPARQARGRARARQQRPHVRLPVPPGLGHRPGVALARPRPALGRRPRREPEAERPMLLEQALWAEVDLRRALREQAAVACARRAPRHQAAAAETGPGATPAQDRRRTGSQGRAWLQRAHAAAHLPHPADPARSGRGRQRARQGGRERLRAHHIQARQRA